MAYRQTYKAIKAVGVMTVAEYKIWASDIVDAILAVGVVQTSDTGQLVISSISGIPTDNIRGYCIFRFNDTHQSTHPIFFKLWFGGRGSIYSDDSRPTLGIQIGRGSDGAGNLTGNVSEIYYTLNYFADANGTLKVNVVSTNTISHADGYLHMALGANAIAPYLGPNRSTNCAEGFFSICRSVGPTGDVDPRYATLFVRSEFLAATSPIQGSKAYSIDYDTTSALASGEVGFLPMVGALSGVGANTPVFPMYGPSPHNLVYNQLLIVNEARVNDGDTFSLAVMGSTARNYTVPGKGFTPMDYKTSALSYATIAILTEGLAV